MTDGTGGPGDHSFRCQTEIQFTCAEPGASTFIEIAADLVRGARLNDAEVDTSGWSAEKGLTITGLAVVGAGVIVYVWAPRQQVAVVPTANASVAGLGIAGRF